MASNQVDSSSSKRPGQSTQGALTVGTFKRLEEIGKGSFATVYKALYSVSDTPSPDYHSRATHIEETVHEPPKPPRLSSSITNTPNRFQKKPGYVAIKSVDVKKLNKKLKENLYSEIEILRDLRHPHIVALVSCQETTAHIHLIMEFCELGDLSYFIRKRDTLGQHATTADMIRKYPNPRAGGLNEVVVRHFLKQLGSALEFLREKDLIHRDVKPQNLLLDPSPEFYAKVSPERVPYAVHERSFVPATGVNSLPTLKLADFGFARSLPQTSMAETLCGSPLYMAPEILRYEKYDAKADLWSVGTVLYEMMVGKPPFRAQNHVDLLRKIEKGDDRIRFAEEVVVSNGMKQIIRSLLKRSPVERSSFEAFFKNPVIQDEIPGLVEDDRPRRAAKPDAEELKAESSKGNQSREEKTPKGNSAEPLFPSSPKGAPSGVQESVVKADPTSHSRVSGVPSSTTPSQVRRAEQRSEPARGQQETNERAVQHRRPSMVSHATAPACQELGLRETTNPSTAVVHRRSSRLSSSPKQSNSLEKLQARDRAIQSRDHRSDREAREARERAAQEVAFERDYVLVEKRAVEVNAFADELAASPKIQGGTLVHQDQHRGAMVRRATTQGSPTSTTGAQVNPSRAMQVTTGKRPDQLHHRQSSYDRRQRDASTTSAITKAINMASGRLLNLGFSPPLGLGRGGPSPPSYSPFPAYPTTKGSLILAGDSPKGQVPMDEDAKMFLLIEEGATRSDVVYCFAEVKYKQLIPLTPSTDHGLGLRQAGISEEGDGQNSQSCDDGLTVDAIVTLSEEALVLYVKALSLLARLMDLANAWWTRKNRGEVIEPTSPRTKPAPMNTTATGSRLNNVVQWVRNRFNEVLEKAEFVRLKLVESQHQLPSDHPSHPSNQHSQSGSTPAMGKSAENVHITPGVTAEKLMYDRAVEMSRTAALNELVVEDLPGCKIAYETAIRMLEAVLQDDEESSARKPAVIEEEKGSILEADRVNGVEAEDREVVVKCTLIRLESSLLKAHNSIVVSSIRQRLAALKKKMQVIANRNIVAPTSAPPTKPPPTPTPNPAVASTSPR